MSQEKNKNEITKDITNLPSSNQVADILLLRTHDFCVDYPVEQQAIVKQQIDSVSQRLAKSIDANDITKLATALQILHNLYNSLHERSVIAFMAQYRPIQNLKISQQTKESEDNKEVIDVGINEGDIQNKTEELDDSFDINSVYKSYED